jgi:hypothetical protein
MPEKTAYCDWLKEDLGSLIDALEGVSDLQKHLLQSRWRDQVMWMEGKAADAQKWYYVLRLAAIVGGVIVPALVSLNLSYLHWLTILVSLLVAISVAVEEFFHFGERWKHYRSNAELLKIEGWQFFQLSGPYKSYAKHIDAYPVFAERVEDTIKHEIDVYITEVVKEKEEEKKKEGSSGKKP